MSEKRTSEWALRIQLEKEEQRVAELQTRERQHLARIGQLEQELLDERYAQRPQRRDVRQVVGVDGRVVGYTAGAWEAEPQPSIRRDPGAAPSVEAKPPAPPAEPNEPTRFSLLEIDS